MTKEIVLPELRKQSIARRIKERIFPGDATEDVLKRQVLTKILRELRVTEPKVLDGTFVRRVYGLDLATGSKRYSAELSMAGFETGAEGVGITVSEVVPSLEVPVRSFSVRLTKSPWDVAWYEREYLMKLSGIENHADGGSSAREPRGYSRREMLNFLRGVLAADVVHKLDSPKLE